jgi:hypothetical protein
VDYRRREQASEALGEMMPEAQDQLRAALAACTSAEVKLRLEELLEGVSSDKPLPYDTADANRRWARAKQAVAAIDRRRPETP